MVWVLGYPSTRSRALQYFPRTKYEKVRSIATFPNLVVSDVLKFFDGHHKELTCWTCERLQGEAVYPHTQLSGRH